MAKILTGITRKHGKLNSADIYDIDFVDSETLEIYKTVVDSSYTNYTRSGWDKIVEQENPYGVYKGLRVTNKRDKAGTTIINADSYPELQLSLTPDQIRQAIEQRMLEIGLD